MSNTQYLLVVPEAARVDLLGIPNFRLPAVGEVVYIPQYEEPQHEGGFYRGQFFPFTVLAHVPTGDSVDARVLLYVQNREVPDQPGLLTHLYYSVTE